MAGHNTTATATSIAEAVPTMEPDRVAMEASAEATSPITVNFHGDAILAVTDSSGVVWVPLRPVCEALGIDAKSQRDKVKADERFSWGVITSTGLDGKNYKMFCLRLDQLAAWLFMVNPNKVKPEVKAKLISYQKELVEVIDKHVRGTKESDPELADLELMVKQAQELLAVRRKQLEQERRIAALEQKVKDMDGDSGYCTVLAYLRMKKLPAPVDFARKVDMRAGKLCRERGVRIGKVSDERFGQVNCYPRDVLALAIDQVLQEAADKA